LAQAIWAEGPNANFSSLDLSISEAK